MNNIFNLKRFGAYLLYDLRNAKNNFLLSGLVLGATPFFMFVSFQLFNLCITGEWGTGNVMIPIVAAFIAIIVTIFNFPSKQYGMLTDKRAGSSWLMIPASTFEKFVSILVICCIVLPVFIAAVFFATDSLLGLIFPTLYGGSLLSNIDRVMQAFRSYTADSIHISFLGIGFMQWTIDILTFTLGAIVFKKSKAAKTFLALMLFGIVCGNLSVILFGSANIDLDSILMDGNNGAALFQMAVEKLNMFMTVFYALAFVVLGGGIFYRLKTLKH